MVQFCFNKYLGELGSMDLPIFKTPHPLFNQPTEKSADPKKKKTPSLCL